jgi:hypothetical protein
MKTKKKTDPKKLKIRRRSIKPEPMYEPYRMAGEMSDEKILEDSFKDLIAEKGGTRGDWEDKFEAIAYHETGKTMDPTQKQVGGGPGRGLYQFEYLEDPSKLDRSAAATAVNRAVERFNDQGRQIPEWLFKLHQEPADFSRLSKEKQQILLIADKLQGPGDFGDVLSSSKDFSEWWRKYHHKKDKGPKAKKFKKDTEEYLKFRYSTPRI